MNSGRLKIKFQYHFIFLNVIQFIEPVIWYVTNLFYDFSNDSCRHEPYHYESTHVSNANTSLSYYQLFPYSSKVYEMAYLVESAYKSTDDVQKLLQNSFQKPDAE